MVIVANRANKLKTQTTMRKLNIEHLNECVKYDESSKTYLRWKTRPRNHFKTEVAHKAWVSNFANKEAGTPQNQPCGAKYWAISISGLKYRLHRIVYALTNSVDPEEMQIDHIDGNGLNNNKNNLRLATPSDNQHNKKVHRNNKSGKRGVCRDEKNNKWRACITYKGKHIGLGRFNTIEEASDAYERKAKELFGVFYGEPR